jgi:hypothetical protein
MLHNLSTRLGDEQRAIFEVIASEAYQLLVDASATWERCLAS